MFNIFQTYPLNNLMIDKKLSVDLVWYLLLGALLS